MIAIVVNIILSLRVMNVSRGKNRKCAIIMSNVKKSISSCRVLVGKPKGKRSLEIPKHRWEDNIKMYLQEVGWETWTGLIWLRIGTVAGTCKRGNEPLDSINCGEFLD